MYTGYYLKETAIIGPDGPTGSFVENKRVVTFNRRSSAYFISDGCIGSVDHICGPKGYSQFYIQEGHIYGPDRRLPWL